MATKQEILKEKLKEYLAAGKEGKGLILDQLGSVTKMNRKAIIRRLKTLQLGREKTGRRGRREIYGLRFVLALREVWQTANEICAERLYPQIPELVSVLRRDHMWSHGREATRQLLSASLGTVKNRIGSFPKAGTGKGKGTTKPSSLKEIIPIRRGPWDNPKPGFGEVDTVAHCGASIAGDYAFSVQYTDIATIWTCLSAQWNKGQKATLESIARIKRRLPFPLLGLVKYPFFRHFGSPLLQTIND